MWSRFAILTTAAVVSVNPPGFGTGRNARAALAAAPPANQPADRTETTAQAIVFESSVAAILEDKCLHCHGEKAQEAGLNLSTPVTVLRGGESGPVVTAGKPDDSLLYQRIAAGEMPPDGELSAAQIAAIRRWIEAGAQFRQRTATGTEVTQQQIEPLMLLRCAPCHGGRRQEAGLDLRTKAAMLEGGKSGPAAVPGRPDDSLLLQRIRSGDMPPRRQLVSVSVKPMEAAELARLEAWIAAGMPEAPDELQAAGNVPDPLVSDEDRQFWAFQPPRQTPPPAVAAVDATANPVDAFVLRRLESHGLSFSARTDRPTLLRRLTFDLIGLPPTVEEVRELTTSDDPLADQKLIDRLLASPHYGVRWGRHWLDAAGYADSEGAQNEDRVRPHLWRYRDYVIRAFNADKPYDRFLAEQLAGDELADYRSAGTITPEVYDNLVATGFLRTAPDRTFADITNFVPDRLEVIADEIQVFGSAVLGLTLHCARCHSHKFDPLPQRDYYRLAAIFKDALDEHDWLKPAERTLPFVTTAERRQWEGHEEQITAQIQPLQQQLAAAQDADTKKGLKEQITQLEAQRKPEPRIRALWSRGVPSATYLLRRGDYLSPGQPLSPGVPAVLNEGGSAFESAAPWPGAEATGRRLALARWLCRPDHPLTARVMVNRVWQHHFGQGLVNTPANFGRAGAHPSHPELLDWLAVEFAHGAGPTVESRWPVAAPRIADSGPGSWSLVPRPAWSIKRLHRLILNSNAYRQSSQIDPAAAGADPDGRLFSCRPLRRMEGETLRDAILAVSGRLDQSLFGAPDAVDVRPDGLVTSQPAARGWRRSVFVLQRRTQLPTILESFDAPQMAPNCLERRESIVAPQALHLLNDKLVYDLAGSFAERVLAAAGTDREAQIDFIHAAAYGRAPFGDERHTVRSALDELTREWQRLAAADEGIAQGPTSAVDARLRALTAYCHAVLNSAAFLYID